MSHTCIVKGYNLPDGYEYIHICKNEGLNHKVKIGDTIVMNNGSDESWDLHTVTDNDVLKLSTVKIMNDVKHCPKCGFEF